MEPRTLETLPVAPSPLTLDYHLRFVPALIAWHLRPEPPRSGFGPHVNILVPLLIAVTIFTLGAGVVSWVDDGTSPGAVIATLVGGGLLVGLLAVSIIESREQPLSYARFSLAMFMLCIVLGATVGVFTVRIGGRDLAIAAPLAWACVLGSALLGHLAGLAVGYWWQRLGAVGGALAVFAWPATIGMIVTDMVLLSG